ncbi:MAG: helix-hairpin-helix domain-containing protein [Thermodesulfobacteriota bacterium]|nr:helix-hairpin-helix domain-containing protein [Thermodesulfobacteriota bacterium]
MQTKRSLLVMFIAALLLFSFSAPVLAADGKININTATQKELCALKRIGPKYAARIVQYRKDNGNFKAPGDIQKVKGVGPKAFEANKDVIVVGDE